VLGTSPFLAVYILSSTAGVLATTALDANTGLSVGGSNALLGVFGAMITYSVRRCKSKRAEARIKRAWFQRLKL